MRAPAQAPRGALGGTSSGRPPALREGPGAPGLPPAQAEKQGEAGAVGDSGGRGAAGGAPA